MSLRNLILANLDPCRHLADYKLRYGVDGYYSFQNFFRTFQNGRIKIKIHHTEIPRCSFCDFYLGRLYICLICRSISCSSHTLLHAHFNNGHDIAIDVDRSELYCCSCSDQVYDPDFDDVLVSKQLTGLGISSKKGFDVVKERSSKRRRFDSEFKGSRLLISSRDRREKWSFPLGLRGLNNLGSTCFMNSVLQALVHTPPLGNFLLRGQHDRDLCWRRSVDQLCLLCELDVIFSAIFSGDRTPYSPAQFLFSWWQRSANLATYEQQDSHEFFISLLDGIHENEGTSTGLHKDPGACQCITHKTFSGLLRSDVTCMTCGSTSTTYDPFVDISVPLDTTNSSSSAGFRRSKSGGPSKRTAESTLVDCLDFFMRSEKLGTDQKLYCQNCQERRDSLKQMSIRRLPLVLCLHVKRFEHSFTRKTSRKVDQYLQYPFHLNMTPYLSSSVLGKRFGNRIFAFDSDNCLDSSSSAEFEIFAVITHSGKLESGHYVTYLRLKGLWYRCDDAWINEVDEDVVRASECYMLFYVQEVIIQNAHEDMSCLRVSAVDDYGFSIAACC